jgi:cytochrome c peroxidase
MRVGKLLAAAAIVWASSFALVVQAADDDRGSSLDSRLARVLRQHDYTGRVESTLETRLGRRIDTDLANLGRLLWFDNVHSLHRDNTCAGCHSPTNGFGDTQSIAIGVDNNLVVGPNRTGPRNQRRSPLVINTAFYPRLMWNGRFFANSAGTGAFPFEDLTHSKKPGDPFVNNHGFTFPAPEGATLGYHDHLLQAQAFIPPTELVEVAGFTGTANTDLSPRFAQFDNGVGLALPHADDSGFRNQPIRDEAIGILNQIAGYRQAFGRVFPEVRHGAPITFDMFGRAIAEFEFTLTFATAPIDEFARGNPRAMTDAEKRGALVFFGEGKCISCHATKGRSNEMFSDFQNHVAGIPQLAPEFGVGKSNMIYDGPEENEDNGAMQITGAASDQYKFRTAPLRNIGVAPAFFHNGAFARLEDAIRFHIDPTQSYNPATAGIDADLYARMGPRVPESMLHPLFQAGGINLSTAQLRDVTQFVKTGLLDPRAKKENLCAMIPKLVPSKLKVLTFEACPSKPGKKDSN